MKCRGAATKKETNSERASICKCGKTFRRWDSHSKYCSHECYVKFGIKPPTTPGVHPWHRRKHDIGVRLKNSVANRIWVALKRNKETRHQRTAFYLGCSIKQLRKHLESQFKPGMTWINYGTAWHVDHIRPCASFDLRNPLEQMACFHFSNLQPLLAVHNYSKSSHYSGKHFNRRSKTRNLFKEINATMSTDSSQEVYARQN